MVASEWVLVAAAFGLLCGVLLGRAPRRTDRALPAHAPSPQSDDPGAEGAFTRLVRALPIGVVLVDDRHRVVSANPAAAAIFGFDADKALHGHMIEAIPNVALERRIAEALRGEASVAPLTLDGAGGRRVYRISMYPLLGPDGEARWVVVFADDQTAAVRLETSRTEFMSNVSHELRTPLSSVKLMLETVMASPEQETRETFLPQALREVDRLGALVEQLLEQARAESGQLKLAPREIDLESVARPIFESFEAKARGKGLTLELEAKQPVRVEADPDRLAQVFVNLLDNAIRHTQPGGRVKLTLESRGSEAVARVRDTGEGIPYRDVPRIFERFYVVDRSRGRASGGAGLGLAIVKTIVDAHGGSISAESALGRGTSVTVRLPIARLKRGA